MMLTPVLQSEIAGQHGANDASFDSFIDSNLILDSGSPAPATPKKANHEMKAKGKVVAPLSALPTRFSETGNHTTMNSLNVSDDFLNYSQNTSASSVTTPTTNNSSTLHNLNFDFFDPHNSDQAGGADNSNAFASESVVLPVTSFGDSPLQGMSPNSTSASNHVFSWNATPSPFYPIQMAHSFPRSDENLDHGMGHHHSAAVAAASVAHHHQRSLSLRDVAPPTASDDIVLADSLNTLPFPSVKLERDAASQYAGTFTDNAPSPITEDHSSPSSSAFSSSLFEQGSPRLDKKRRLDSPSESMTSNQSSKGTKGSSMTRSSTGSTKKGSVANSKRSRASTLTDKNGPSASPASVVGLGFNPASLIENVAAASAAAPSEPSVQVNSGAPLNVNQIATGDDTGMEGQDESFNSERGDSAAPRSNNKRPPPSASQVTESGQPFPVIDTSAKHSSLFVPPDTSGLTKREARLVKNRAAAFLSRQRKREQFDELEIKCKSLCRLVWRFWEIVAGPNHDINFAEKFSQTRILPIVLEEEADEVREVLEMVVALKGGSVAPTEDGQLQGAMAAGVSSANGKIVNNAAATSFTAKTMAPPSSGPPTTPSQNGNSEIARLQAELQESKKRENALQAELAQERSMRINDSYTQEARKPFKGSKQDEALSLTISPEYVGEEDEGEDQSLIRGRRGDIATKRVASRSSARLGASRTSERLQRQQSNVSLNSANAAANGGQRKAAGAALMMVLFSFALFGLPNGQIPRAGGITRVGNAEDFSVGKVLGAPLSGAQYSQEEDEEMIDYDLTSKQAPSSHLSVKDLLPPTPDMSDLLNLEDEEEDLTSRSKRMSRSFRDVLSGSQDDDEDNVVDYQAFAKDLGASLDWDVQRGFIVIGSDHDRIETEDAKDSSGDQTHSNDEKNKNKDDPDAPTRLTLFVPAPDVTADGLEVEDRFYDAPLASADVTSSTVLGRGKDEVGHLTQAEATRAALRVLRNHRIAQEAAALATSRRLGKKPSPSQRVGSPHLSTKEQHNRSRSRQVKGKASDCDQVDEKMDVEGEEEQDFSTEVMDATTTTNKIRGTDFYQLEFSLSGAKVRNVAELAKLLGVARNKKD